MITNGLRLITILWKLEIIRFNIEQSRFLTKSRPFIVFQHCDRE